MTRTKKPTPLEAFELNMSDARQLVRLAEGLTNQRTRRLRAEMREKLGQALRVPLSKRGELDCIKSGDAYVILTPGSRLSRAQLEDLKPLLRQAIVAAAAAMETYMADVTVRHVGRVISSDAKATEKVRRVPMSVGDWLYIEQRYEQRRRGLKNRVVEPYIREFASTSPTKVGELLSLLGVKNWSKAVDHARGGRTQDTVQALEQITQRRNKIAHEGDRRGYGRATITIAEVIRDLDALESIVRAIDKTIANHFSQSSKATSPAGPKPKDTALARSPRVNVEAATR